MMGSLLQAVISLLQSADDSGCDGLVCVGENEFHALRKLVHEQTGQLHGEVEELEDYPEDE